MTKIKFGLSEHHAIVKAKLKKAVISKELTQEQADKIYIDWLNARRELLKKGGIEHE